MKTKQFLLIAALIATMSTTAMANTPAPATTAPTAQEGAKRAPLTMENFGAAKEKILARLSKRASAIQEKQACVQAAANPEALKSCLPKMGKGKHGWGKGKHEGRGAEYKDDDSAPE